MSGIPTRLILQVIALANAVANVVKPKSLNSEETKEKLQTVANFST